MTVLSCHPPARLATPAAEMVKGDASFPRTDTAFTALLKQHLPGFDSLESAKDRWGVQVIYTRIDRNAANEPAFTHYYYNVDPARYFYPASTVKLPVALLALQRLNELAVPGMNATTTMITGADAPGQTAVANDPTAADGRPSIAHYIKKIFLVSDNDAYNRLYEFLGQEYINANLHRRGYDSAQILHRLDVSITEAEHRAANPVSFYDSMGRPVYRQPGRRSSLVYQPRHTLLGTGFLRGGELVPQPFDFSRKNRLTLPDLHSILISTLFPESVPAKQRFNLTAEDYRLVRRYMSMKPQDSDFPQYDTSYPDAYSKLLLFGGEGRLEAPAVRIFNKEGDAYGFLTDAAYIIEPETGIEFLLSAMVYCNSDGIFNDDRYDYKTVGLPFLKALGRAVYDAEAARPKKYRPDLNFHLD